MRHGFASLGRAAGWVLGLVVAAGLRLYGIGFGAHVPLARPDEETFLYGVDHNTLRSGWPTGFFHVAEGVRWLEGHFYHLTSSGLGCLYASDPTKVLVPLRLVSVLADVATCVVVGLIARRITARPWAFTLGVWAYGVNYLAVREAHFGMANSALVLVMMLCVFACLKAAEDLKWLGVVGALAGAAFGLKYSAAILIFPILATRPWRDWFESFVGFAWTLLGFVFVSPEVFDDPRGFWEGFAKLFPKYGSGDPGLGRIDLTAALEPGWKWHFFTTLPTAFGWLGLLFGVVGLLIVVRQGWRHTPVVAYFVGAALMLAPLQQLFTRYALPIVPALAVGLAMALLEVSSRFRLAWALLAFAMPLATALQFDHLLAQKDTRTLAVEWLGHHTGQGLGWYQRVHIFDPDVCGQSFVQTALDADFKDDPPAEFVFWPAPLLPGGRVGRLEAPEPTGPCFEKVKVFDPGVPWEDVKFDLFDSFFVPFGSFAGVERPGPFVTVFRNNCGGGK